MVRDRAVAYIARAVGAVAGSIPRRLPGGSATDTAASAKGLAPRSYAPNGIRNHDGRSWRCISGRSRQAAQQSCERSFQRSPRRREEPCGFAAALGRRKGVAHNSTGPTSVSIDLSNGREAVARPEASEATGACLVRQRLTRWEHFSVRQYVFSSCLPRSIGFRQNIARALGGAAAGL